MAKPILFIDFDGTLCHDRFWRSLPVEQYEKVQEFLFGEDKTLLNDWMRGKRTAEGVNESVAQHLGIPFQELWQLFVHDSENMYVPQEALDTIQALREKFTTILITVNMDSFSRYTVPALELDRYFDAISNSYYEGLFKSDVGGEVFRKYLSKYDAPAEESILIDDSPSAGEAFSALGGIFLHVSKDKDIAYHLNRISR